jgi:hypothetical protein
LARSTCGSGVTPRTCSIRISRIGCPEALSTSLGLGPRLTTTLFSMVRLFTIRVLLMITVVCCSGMTHLRTRGATKSLEETKMKGPEVGWPKLMETFRE